MNATKIILAGTMMFMLLATAYALNPAEAAETKDKARTETKQKIQRTVKSMIEFAEKLQHEAETQNNSEAQTEIQIALDYIRSAENNVTYGKLEEAVSDPREAKTHLQLASELLRQS